MWEYVNFFRNIERAKKYLTILYDNGWDHIKYIDLSQKKKDFKEKNVDCTSVFIMYVGMYLCIPTS